MRNYERYITVKHQYEGFHWYADAPDQVAFLKNRHRHMFHVEATLEVFHDDRELEFFIVKDTLIRQILPFTALLDNLGSCEQQAERIIEGLINAYGEKRRISVTVSEDNESSGQVIWDPNSLFNRQAGQWQELSGPACCSETRNSTSGDKLTRTSVGWGIYR